MGRAPSDTRCPRCNGELKPLVDVKLRPDRYQQDGPTVVYLRCESCNHIQIETR